MIEPLKFVLSFLRDVMTSNVRQRKAEPAEEPDEEPEQEGSEE